MRPFLLGSFALALLVTAPVEGAAQQPTQSAPNAQAAELIQRLQQSGLSQDAIRARLQAAGYPSAMLDAYLASGAGSDGANAPVPGEQIFSAVRTLGLMDSLSIDSVRTGRTPRRGADVRPDPVLVSFADSLGVAVDSIDIVADSLPESIARRLDAWRAAKYRAERLSRQYVDSGHTIFGLNLFEAGSTQFDPNLSGPVDPNYRIGPGDELVLILTGDVESSYELPVTREGFIVIPQVGQVSVANLTMAQLDDVLYSRLRRAYSGIGRSPNASTRFSVSVARLRSNQVYVVGDVMQPGSYRISSAGTAMSALYAAGGPSGNGSLRRVEVRRGGQTVATLDVYDYLLRGSSANDPRLQSGDVVFVPSHGPRVRIWGEVIRPAIYEIAEGEELDDLIQAAGGFTARADRRRVQIERILPPTQRQEAGNDRIVMDVPAEQLATATPPAVPLHAGDVVRVFTIADRVRSQVAVSGNVWTPGRVAFQPGMRLSDALRRAGGLKPDAYLGQVLVTRQRPDSTRVQLRAALADTTGRAIDDLVLADGDEIQVFSMTEFRPDRYVVVSGAVRKGGRIPYREGMTLRDAVLLAGGLHESALVTEAEVARMPANRPAGVRATTQVVSIDSSYLFEQPLDGVGLAGGAARSARRTPDVVLQPYDNVLIHRKPDWALPQSVALTGEVVRPGRYTLRSKTERLSDVIERAGGLTAEANADGVVFIRSQQSTGRVGVDLAAVVRNARHRDNLVLVDGDSIAVPTFTPVVTVRGNVNSPAGVAYVPGANIEYYVSAAGGANATGDYKRAFVTQPNGKVESRRDRGIFLPDAVPQPRPGAIVYVPPKGAESIGSSLTGFVTTFTQVIGSLVGIFVLVKQL